MRYLRLYRSFFANCLSRAMEFRVQFVAGILVYAIWSGVSLLFIQAVFGNVEAVRGWTRSEMWVLYGSSVILESWCWGLLGPNMFRFSTSVQDGTLDLALTKPVPTQFFVSARYVDLNGLLNCVSGIALLLIGLRDGGNWPDLTQWLVWMALMICSFLIAYSLWFASVTISVWAVKIDAIAVLFDSMMQLARFPVDLYPRRWIVWLTWALPVAFLTTFPAQALLGRGDLRFFWAAPLMAAVSLLACSAFFRFALRFYGSASS